MMKTDKGTDIKVGIGLGAVAGAGAVKFGMTEAELIVVMDGPADRIEEAEYVDGSGDKYRELYYGSKGLSFSFDKEDDYRLGTISISAAGYCFRGCDLHQKSKSFVRKVIARHTNELMVAEDCSVHQGIVRECLDSDKLGMVFWFDVLV